MNGIINRKITWSQRYTVSYSGPIIVDAVDVFVAATTQTNPKINGKKILKSKGYILLSIKDISLLKTSFYYQQNMHFDLFTAWIIDHCFGPSSKS